jgi:hypothetical protein
LLRWLKKINYINKLACGDCSIRPRCTAGTFRTISRLENEAVLDRMAARLAKRPGVLWAPCLGRATAFISAGSSHFGVLIDKVTDPSVIVK